MKRKISVSIGDDVLKEIDLELMKGFFRNKSHVLEYAVKKLLRENVGDRK